jgi:secondary thiamine-phosphate synthase enzyme
MSSTGSFKVSTGARHQIVDVTDLVGAAASRAGDGVLLLNVPHTTAALFVCEDDEKLRRDFVRLAEHLFDGSGPFEHDRNDNPNAEAHLLSVLAGTQALIPVTGGRVSLGTYQNVLFFELDGPKERTVEWRLLAAG